MKKYIAPEVEIKKFNVEDIMNASAATVTDVTDHTAGANASSEVSYNELFGIN